ncbi:MAG: type II toxin-antitoxin system death-on-curing family toxin [Clostridia bacterium]|nr:type II toxin-antitoxin system death-on-curing family toxin [Clostridia bacterium]
MIKLLDKKHIYIIHQHTINKFGGDMGHYNNTDQKIESILAQQHGYFGYDKYPTIYEKAAMLIYFFANSHCFVDGNKRVAITAGGVFLKMNGLEDHLDDMEGYNKTMEIASRELHGVEVDKYIKGLSIWLSTKFY